MIASMLLIKIAITRTRMLVLGLLEGLTCCHMSAT